MNLEDHLGDVFRKVRVSIELAKGGRIDQVEMALHQTTKRIFVPVLRILFELFGLT